MVKKKNLREMSKATNRSKRNSIKRKTSIKRNMWQEMVIEEEVAKIIIIKKIEERGNTMDRDMKEETIIIRITIAIITTRVMGIKSKAKDTIIKERDITINKDMKKKKDSGETKDQ